MASREVHINEQNPPPAGRVTQEARDRAEEHRQRQEEREQRDAHEHRGDAGRGGDPEQIRHDIDVSRERMDRTIDTLQLRLSPQYLAQCTMDKIRYQRDRAGSGISRLIRNNPIPAIVSGVGLTWLIGAGMRGTGRRQPERRGRGEPSEAHDAELRARHALYEAGMESQGSAYEASTGTTGAGERAAEYGQQARDKAGEYGQRVQETAREYSEQARERASELGHRASKTAAQMRDRAGEMGHKVREQAGEAGDRLRATTGQAQEKARDLFEEHPLTVGLAVLATGLAVGLLIPATRKEDEIMGEQRDQLLDRAQEYGSEMVERGQAVAQRTAEAASEAAREEGLGAEQVREQGEDIARRAGDVAAEAGEAARDEAEQQGFTDDRPGEHKKGEGI